MLVSFHLSLPFDIKLGPCFPVSNKRKLCFLKVKGVHLNNLGIHSNNINKFMSIKTWLILTHLNFGKSIFQTTISMVSEGASNYS